MAAFVSRCKHCGEIIEIDPKERIILFVGEGISDSFFNYRCSNCEGINHHNAANTRALKQVMLWFASDAERMPQQAPACHADQEIAEIIETQAVGFAPINSDDLLDLMIQLRTIPDCEDVSYAQSISA